MGEGSVGMPRAGYRFSARIWVLISGVVLVNAGSFLVIPFLAVYLKDRFGLGAGDMGIALAIKLISNYGLALVGGVWSDWVGPRRVMIIGLVLRIAALVLLAQAGSLAGVVLAMAFLGASGAIYTPAGKAALIALAPPEQRLMVFSLRNTAGNAGIAVGPMLGAWLVALNPASLFYVAAIMHAVFLVITVLFIQHIPGNPRAASKPFKGMRKILGRPDAWWLVTATAVFWFLTSQFELSMPLEAARTAGALGPGIIYTLNAAMVITLQIPLTAVLQKRMAPAIGLGYGIALTGVGMALMPLNLGLIGLVLAIAVFTLGELIISPLLDELPARLAPRGLAATALGLMSITAAAGGAAGQVLGGRSYEWAQVAGRNPTFWYGFGLSGCVFALFLLISWPRFAARRRKSGAGSGQAPARGAGGQGQRRSAAGAAQS